MQRQKWEVLFSIGLVSLIFASSLNFIYLTWMLDEHGLSIMSQKLPYWDFSNLWAGGRLAASGAIAHIFDISQYRSDLRALFTPYLSAQEWSYPPSMLLIGAPLSALPILPAYLLWTFGTALLFALSLRLLTLPWWACLLVALSPAGLMNIALGQNGALTAALLIGGLSIAPKRPILAGILFGLLTMKPQIGILIPICLLASRNYRAIASAVVTTGALFIVTGLIFGFESWLLFWSQTRPLMTSILEAPYPQDYQGNAVSFFVMARWLGLGVVSSYGFQAFFSLAAILTAIWLWSRRAGIDTHLRVCATAILTTVASPYGYTYDTLAVSAAVALLFLKYRKPHVIVLAIGWIYAPLNQSIPISIGVLFPTLILLSMLPLMRRSAAADRQADGAPQAPVTAS